MDQKKREAAKTEKESKDKLTELGRETRRAFDILMQARRQADYAEEERAITAVIPILHAALLKAGL